MVERPIRQMQTRHETTRECLHQLPEDVRPLRYTSRFCSQSLARYRTSISSLGINSHIIYIIVFAKNEQIEKNYVQARYHFLHSLDARSFAQMTIECHMNFGYPSEFDLFLAQNLLLYLTLRQLRGAEEFFDHYVSNHPSVVKTKISPVSSSAAPAAAAGSDTTSSIDYYESPLINFVHLLILVLKR